MIAVSWGEPNAKADPRVPLMPRLHEIVREVANKHRLPVNDLLASGRGGAVVSRARQEAYYLCRVTTRAPYKIIGRLFSNRDHQTIAHGIQAHMSRMEFANGAN